MLLAAARQHLLGGSAALAPLLAAAAPHAWRAFVGAAAPPGPNAAPPAAAPWRPPPQQQQLRGLRTGCSHWDGASVTSQGMMHCASRRWLITALLCISAMAPQAAGGRNQLAATVMVNGFGDLEGAAPGSQLPSCLATLRRARQISDTVSFALAVFPMAVDKEGIDPWTFKDAAGRHVPANADVIARWRRGLAACFRFAASEGFRRLHILGHVDPVHPVLLKPATWRNLLLFAPRERVGKPALSYEDVMLKPVVAALNEVASPAMEVWFSVSGEMGLSNFVAADQWRDVLATTRSELQKKRWQDVKVATALNWQMACGCVAAADPVPGTFDPLKYNASYASEYGKVKQFALPFQRPFKELLEANDYVGLSGYGAGYPLSGLTWRDMEIPLQTLAYELKFLGISLKDLIKSKPVIYVEQGLGGVLKYQMMPAPDLGIVSKYPASGNWPERYSKDVDPWQRGDFATYRRAFYKATLDLLSRPAGQQYKLDGVYVWSVGSFDVFGVHPTSSASGGDGGFADQEIIDAVKKSNGISR